MYGIGSHTHTQTKSRARRSCDCYEIQIVISLHLHRRISLRYLHQRQISYFDWANNSSDFTANLRQLPNCMRRCKMFSPSCSIFLPIVVENLPERFVVSGFANKKNFFSIFLEFVLVTVNASVRVSQFDLYGFFSLERERNGNEQKKMSTTTIVCTCNWRLLTWQRLLAALKVLCRKFSPRPFSISSDVVEYTFAMFSPANEKKKTEK